jgi:acetyltransferase EpsM
MKIVVVGHGGHSKVIADLILSNEENIIIGFLDDKYNELGFIKDKYFGPISSAKEFLTKFPDVKFVIAIGDNGIRQSTVQKLGLSDNYYVTVIHKTAVISPTVNIGLGTVIMPNSVINAESKIGNHSIINTGSVIEHDSIVGDFSHVGPSATLTGTVHLGEGVYIGAGSTIIPNIKLGDWAIIGAGATVITDIPSYSTAVGIPAKVKKMFIITGGERNVKNK